MTVLGGVAVAYERGTPVVQGRILGLGMGTREGGIFYRKRERKRERESERERETGRGGFISVKNTLHPTLSRRLRVDSRAGLPAPQQRSSVADVLCSLKLQ